MKILIYLGIVVLVLSVLAGCDNEEKIVGCRLYKHIYTDQIGAASEYDEVHLFFAAGAYEEIVAPLTFSLIESETVADSISMELFVYGVSPTKEPSPYVEMEWRSDTLLVWYSSEWPHLQYIDVEVPGLQATPPCPMGYYRIDHVIVFHPSDVVVYPHEDILH
jgi:hypothetical protein